MSVPVARTTYLRHPPGTVLVSADAGVLMVTVGEPSPVLLNGLPAWRHRLEPAPADVREVWLILNS